MRLLQPAALASFWQRLARDYRLRLPVRLADGSRAFGGLGDGPPALVGGIVAGKPTAAFFPQQETLFRATADTVETPAAANRPLAVVGLTSCDLAALRFIDRFFAEGWRDDRYFAAREGALLIGVAGACGRDGSPLPIAGGDCDLELIRDAGDWYVAAYSAAGEGVVDEFAGVVPAGTTARLRQHYVATATAEGTLIAQASALLRSREIPDVFWAEIGERCIACTGCNLVCPTCTCFGVQDWRYPEAVERSRMWDSCQLDGFMREASGHNPLGTEALRSRRRIHHKLAADPDRWGEISCVACGRCDATCPTGIGIIAVARELLARFG